MKRKNPKNIRLGTDVIPIKYEIHLKPDLKNFTFEGKETVYLSIKRPTKILTLHSKEIEIDTASIYLQEKSKNNKKNELFAKKISYNEKKETVSFIFSKTIQPGTQELTLVFKGILNDKMRGFYRSKYNIGTMEYNIATTQFESTDARSAFPCFDEPAHKAVFNVSLIVPKGKTAISNTLPISRIEHEAGYEIVKFSPTPKMSTYLVAFIVGDFEYLEKKSNRGVIVRVYTTPGKKYQAKFALNTTVKVLEFYEEYFDIPYPLETLDMIAIPDFSSLAMENWGAITFREIGLLVDEEKTSINSKEMIAEVIAHELSHQWFGNLVTMEWWTHLWLNEGFASYIPYLAINKLFPKWNIWERFNTYMLNPALRLDSLKNTHPVEIEVNHPNEIGEIFDAVSYNKGASIIKMLANYLGEKDFKEGLKYYLKKHSYKNTSTIQLWQAFEKISRKPVTKIMQNWTSKSGYPLIRVRLENKNIYLSQERFFSSHLSKVRTKDNTIWQTPIMLGNNKNEKNILLKDKSSIEGIDFSDDWIKINLGESSFFRTAYSKELLEQLIKPVKNKILPVEDRLGIVRDLFALSEAGIIPTTNTLEFLSAYENEDSYAVWVEIASGLTRLKQLLVREKSYKKLDTFVLSLFSNILLKMGWEKNKSEPHTNSMLRSLTLNTFARSQDKKIIIQAKKYFTLLKKGKYIDPDIRSSVYTAIASSGGIQEYQSLLKLYKKETLHEEKERIGDAMGDFNDPKILKLVCEFAFSKDVRSQDSWRILYSVGMNFVAGRDVWFAFIKNNWRLLVSKYGEGGHTLSTLIKAIAGSAENKHLKEFNRFFETHDALGAERSIQQIRERLESNIAWLELDGKKINKFLK